MRALLQGRVRYDELDRSWGDLWRQNAQQRDFTVNSIMYDPFSHLLFDYTGGMADCNKQRLHTCKPPWESFEEDPVRMLRGVRLAARCGKQHAHLPVSSQNLQMDSAAAC